MKWCTCGHVEEIHTDDGCEFDACNCPGFQEEEYEDSDEDTPNQEGPRYSLN